jgi:hypothetical protein
VPRAVNEGTPIVLSRPDAAASQAFRSLANEFLRRQGDAPLRERVRGAERRGAGQAFRGLADVFRSRDGDGETGDQDAASDPSRRLVPSTRRR